MPRGRSIAIAIVNIAEWSFNISSRLSPQNATYFDSGLAFLISRWLLKRFRLCNCFFFNYDSAFSGGGMWQSRKKPFKRCNSICLWVDWKQWATSGKGAESLLQSPGIVLFRKDDAKSRRWHYNYTHTHVYSHRAVITIQLQSQLHKDQTQPIPFICPFVSDSGPRGITV